MHLQLLAAYSGPGPRPPFPVDYPITDNLWFWVWVALICALVLAAEAALLAYRSRRAARGWRRRPAVLIPAALSLLLLGMAGVEWAAFHQRAVNLLTSYGPGYSAMPTLQELGGLAFVCALACTLFTVLSVMSGPTEAR